jgi:glutathione reductase (NADPH)
MVAPNALTGDKSWTVSADLVVHAAGRVPDLDSLDLAAGNVEIDNDRLKLNEFMQSVSNSHAYAAGDAANVGPALTPVSSHDGRVVASNMLQRNQHKPNYRGIPSVAFTIPPIAAVGLSEKSAREKGLKFRVNSARVPGWFTARRLNELVYGFKTLVEEGLAGSWALTSSGLTQRKSLTYLDLRSGTASRLQISRKRSLLIRQPHRTSAI